MTRIVVVDDEPAIRDLCAATLREAGHQVVLADNGQSALDIHRVAPQDLVLLDMFMPIKDGQETLIAHDHHLDALQQIAGERRAIAHAKT